jgi:hypothetical protein
MNNLFTIPSLCYFLHPPLISSPFRIFLQLSIHSHPQSKSFTCTESSSIIMNVIIIFISIIIMYFVLRRARNFFQSELSTECDLVLPLVNSSISFPQSDPVAALVSFLFYRPYCRDFNNVF